MNTERAQVGWGFWLWWVLATFVGSAVGVVVGVAVLGPVLGAVGLAGAGVMQWLVLRQQLSRSGWWILASSVGLAIGLVVGVAASAAGGDDAAVVSLPVLGASVGIAQWRVLRRQVSRAGWWIVVNVVGLAVGLAATLVVFGVADGSGGGAVTGALEDAIFGAVIGAVVGAITGAVMVWMLRQRAAKELGPSQAAE